MQERQLQCPVRGGRVGSHKPAAAAAAVDQRLEILTQLSTMAELWPAFTAAT